MKGKVFLIGAGPGDPGLLTLRGRECLAMADLVVYDALIGSALLDFSRLQAKRLYVGKRGRKHAREQNEINEILRREASKGKLVARLKGGDPFLFGRGGEEAAYLHDHGIPFEVVPGVSSASGAAGYAGIPLTDRRLGSMVTLVTGHEGQGKEAEPVEWSRISRRSTLVIFMGLDQLDLIAERLLHLNWNANTPAAVIRWGSLLSQQVVEGTLGTIAGKTAEAKLTSPVLIVIGRVVGLRKKLRWFDTKPLFGKRIVITRAIEQAAEFARLLEGYGAEVIAFPTIQILPPKTWQPVDEAITTISSFDWVLFTSVNGVQAFFARMKMLGKDIRELKGIRLGAIGPKTTARLTALGLRVDAFPEEYRAEALAEVVGDVKGANVLLARAEVARDVLPKTLESRGARVTIAPVYRTVKNRRLGQDLKKRFMEGEIDLVTFTSSSTVDGFMAHFSAKERRQVLDKTKTAVIGPITGNTLKGYGFRADVRAKRYTIEALGKAILQKFS